VRLTVLGGCGAWPEAGAACSGFLVEHDGFRLVVDLGYATLPRLLGHVRASAVDAVFLSHGHPDHCADLNPLLRARALGDERLDPLPVYCPPGAADAVLALDPPAMLGAAYDVRSFEPGAELEIGPFRALTRLLPHWPPNAGVRVEAGGASLVYTGDAGPDPALVELARGADLLVAEATYVDEVPERWRRYLSCARGVGGQATEAAVGRLLLTHLWPGTDPDAARDAAARGYRGEVGVATGGLVADLG
jgi:ribonuclease BN (tRNA processing enzyme)